MTRARLAPSGFFDERGVALPLAMVTLVLLTTLTLAFMAMSKSEPVIAANHARATEARALAESGLERALWALTAGVDLTPLSGAAPSPYNGAQFITLNTRGGAFVTISSTALTSGGQTCTPSGSASERCVLSIGWSPTSTPASGAPVAHRRVLALAATITNLAINVPCALCVAGELQIGGNTTIDSTQDPNPSCGQKVATYTSGFTALGGSYTLKGSDGNTTANQSTDYQQNQGTSEFSKFTLGTGDLNTLKALAKANGTYFGPGFPSCCNSDGTAISGSGWSGSLTFNSSGKVKSGIVFVDTVSGNNPTSTSLASDLPSLNIHGNPFLGTGGDGIFRGWLVSNGAVSISGGMQLNGLVYAANDFTYNGTGGGAINGLVISQNLLDTSATIVDTSTGGNSSIVFNCNNALGGGNVPQGWFVRTGTYSEPND
jgi:hypothetical protein